MATDTNGLSNFGGQAALQTDAPLVIYPRAHAALKYIYNDGTDATTGVVPSRATVTLRPHHQCGTAEVEINASVLPFDLRRLNGIFLCVYMGAVESSDRGVSPAEASSSPQRYLQFAGYVDMESVTRGPDGSKAKLSARDLSALFRDLRPVYALQSPSGQVTDPTPLYSDSVLSAIERVYSWAGFSLDQLEIDDRSGGTASQPLTSLVTDSRAWNAPIPVASRHDLSAWEVIEHVAAVAGLLVSVDVGKLVIRKPADAFVLPDDPRAPPLYSFMFGDEAPAGYSQAYELEVQKKFIRNRRGVTAVAFDPAQRQIIQADYPPTSALPPKKAPKFGPTKQTKPRAIQIADGGRVLNNNSPPEQPREVIAVGGDGVHSVSALQNIAERYYRERSRQELEGKLTTHVWDDALFDLRNGDRIEIKTRPELEAELQSRDGEADKVAFLRQHLLISEDAARVMLAQIRARESTTFYLRSITHEWSTEGARSQLDFISIVEV